MLRKTNKFTKDGRSIYVDQKGNENPLPRVHHKSFSNSIPQWCWNFIQPIRKSGFRWNIKKDRMKVC